jgi:uncharacterized protein (DUF39 family)
MHAFFSRVYPLKHLTVGQVITSLKEKKIDYNSKFRCENIQGCFVGVKFRLEIDEEEYEAGIDKTDQSIKQPDLELEIKSLKRQLFIYKNMDEYNSFKQCHDLVKETCIAMKLKLKSLPLVLTKQKVVKISLDELSDIFNI